MDITARPTALQAITLKNNLKLPLLLLSAKVRNEIYTFTGLASTTPIKRTIRSSSTHSLNLAFKPPGLLTTCKQIRSEATALIYKPTSLDLNYVPGASCPYLPCSHGICRRVTSARFSARLICEVSVWTSER